MSAAQESARRTNASNGRAEAGTATSVGEPRRSMRSALRHADGFEAQQALLTPDAEANVNRAGATTRAGARSALGDEVASTPVRTGRGRAEAENAAAVTDGQEIDVHAGVAASGVGLVDLLAHELVHVAQPRAGAPNGDAETEADALSPAVRAGTPVRPSAGVGTGRARKGLGEWFKENFPEIAALKDKATDALTEGRVIDPDWSGLAEERARTPTPTPTPSTVVDESLPREESSVGKKIATENYVGDRETVKGEGGKAKTKVVEGTEVIDTTDEASGSVTKGKVVYSGTADARDTHTESKVETVTPTGDRSSVSKVADVEERLDRPATAEGAIAELQKAKAPLERKAGQLADDEAKANQALERTRARRAELERQLASMSAQEEGGEEGGAPDDGGRARLESEVKTLKKDEESQTLALLDASQERKYAEEHIAKLDQLQGRLRQDPNSVEAVAAEAAGLENPVRFEKKYSKVEASSEEGWRSSALDMSAEKFSAQKHVEENADGRASSSSSSSTKGAVDKEKWGAGVEHRKQNEVEVVEYAKSPDRERQAEIDAQRDLVDAGLAPASDSPDRKSKVTESASARGGYNLVDGAHASGDRSRTVERADGSSSEEKLSGGVTYKDGLAANGEASVKDKNADGTFVDGKLKGGVNKDGANYGSEVGAGAEGEHGQVRVKASSDGSFTVTVKPVPGVDGKPPTYTVVTTIKVSVGAGSSLETSKKGTTPEDGEFRHGETGAKAGASGRVGVGATYTHTRTLTWDEAKKYLEAADAVDKGGKAPSELPEFGFLEKARAWKGESNAMNGLGGALGDPEAARAMGANESVTLDLSAEVGADVNAGVGDVGAGVEGSAAVKRTVTVTRKEGNLVEVTVAFTQEDSIGGNLSAGAGVASGSASVKRRESRGESVTFVLDASTADYGSKFSTISKTLSRSDLETLRKQYAADLTANRRSRGESTDKAGAGKVGVVGLGVGDGHAFSEDVDLRGSDSTGTFKGSSSAEAKLSGGEVELVGSRLEEEGVASVDAGGGISVDITDKEESSGLDVGQAVDGLIEAESPKAAAEKAMKLDELLKSSETALVTFSLSPSDVMALVGRAHQDRGEWNRHGLRGGTGAYNAWARLRSELLAPRVDAEWLAVDRDKAAQLGRARSIARFMESAGGDGREIIQSAMRNWGKSHGMEEKDGGTYAEFPPSLSKQKPAYDSYFQRVGGIDAALRALEADADGLSKAGQLSSELSLKGVQLTQAVRGASDFEDPAARAEMLRRLSTGDASRQRAYQEFLKRWHAARGTPLPEESTAALEQAQAQRRIHELLNVCRSLKSDEHRLLSAAEEEMDSLLFRDEMAVIQSLQRLEGTYGVWKRTVLDLRGQYAIAGTPPNEWKVSRAPKAHRSDLEPNVIRLNALRRQTAHFELHEASLASNRLRRSLEY